MGKPKYKPKCKKSKKGKEAQKKMSPKKEKANNLQANLHELGMTMGAIRWLKHHIGEAGEGGLLPRLRDAESAFQQSLRQQQQVEKAFQEVNESILSVMKDHVIMHKCQLCFQMVIKGLRIQLPQ